MLYNDGATVHSSKAVVNSFALTFFGLEEPAAAKLS
jgi:hypothetical protein